MRIVVTGSNGLVGSRLSRVLKDHGHEVLGLSRGPRAQGGPERYIALDLSDGAAVDSALNTFLPEVIVNTASMTEVDACEHEPVRAYRANVVAAQHLAEGARRLNAHLVHVSTDYVFDGDHGPYTEDAVPNPRGVYATTKHMGEQAVRVLSPSWTIARTAVVYGWPQASRANFGAWLVGSLSRGSPVKLFNDQFVSPTLADNLADMLAEIAARKVPGVLHTAGADVVDRVAFGRALCQQFGFDEGLIQPVRMADARLSSPRPLRSGLVTTKVAQALAAKPLGLAESLRRFHKMWQGADAKTAAA